MKLTFFMLADLNTGRGTENVLLNLLKYKPLEINVTIIVPIRNDGIRIEDSEIKKKLNGAKIIRLNVGINNGGGSMFETAFSTLFVKPVLRDLRKYRDTEILQEVRDTDIVYLFYNPYSVFFYGMNMPIIGSNHTDSMLAFNHQLKLFKNIYRLIIYKLYYKNINGLHVFPGNKYLLCGNNFKYNMLLPNGIDTSLFYPDYNVNNIKIKFLFIAALTKNKGLDILLPLIDKFKSNNKIEFHIAGAGPMENEIKQRSNIIYHGIVNNDELSKLYREADIFIYPSHADAFPMVILEALSSGLYILCPDYLKGNFDDFENEYLEYLPLNITVWYNRVNEIINDRDIIKHDKSKEYNYIKNNYSWEIISRKFYDYMIKFYNESKK